MTVECSGEIWCGCPTHQADADNMRALLLEWIRLERAQHAGVKYAQDTDQRRKLVEETVAEGYGDGWHNFAGNYMHRATVIFGLQTELGRQAMGKAIVTLMHCLETAILVHGPIPKPGVPSGELQGWIPAGWRLCPDCNGEGTIWTMGADPDLTESERQCLRCVAGRGLVRIDDDERPVCLGCGQFLPEEAP